MIITASYDVLDKEMTTLMSLLSSKDIQEIGKAVTFWIKNNEVRLCAYNGGTISTAAKLEGAVVEFSDTETEEEYFITIMAKDITNPLSTFKGLQRTIPSEVEFVIEDNRIQMSVSEVAMEDIEEERKHLYNQKTPFLMGRNKTNNLVLKAIKELDLEVNGEELESDTLKFFLELLYPVVSREVREATSAIMFGEEHVYTFLPTYVAIVNNEFGTDTQVSLPPSLRGFKLQNTSANFLRNLIGQSPTFKILRKDLERGAVELMIKAENMVASIKCPDMSRAHNITGDLETPQNGVVVDKAYLLDALKRIALNPEIATVSIKMDGSGVGEMTLKSKSVKQVIPVLMAKGEGEYVFQLKSDMISNLVFGQSKILGTDTFIYLEKDESGQNLSLAIKDNTQLWMTKVRKLAIAQEHSAWR